MRRPACPWLHERTGAETAEHQEADFGHIICAHGSAFELTSELFVAEGDVNGKVGRHYFRWHDLKFSRLHFEQTCST